MSSIDTIMTTPHLPPDIHVGAVDPNEPKLPLASADVLRYARHGQYEVRVEICAKTAANGPGWA